MTSALEDRSLYLENKNDMTKVYFDNKIHSFLHHFRDLIEHFGYGGVITHYFPKTFKGFILLRREGND